MIWTVFSDKATNISSYNHRSACRPVRSFVVTIHECWLVFSYCFSSFFGLLCFLSHYISLGARHTFKLVTYKPATCNAKRYTVSSRNYSLSQSYIRPYTYTICSLHSEFDFTVFLVKIFKPCDTEMNFRRCIGNLNSGKRVDTQMYPKSALVLWKHIGLYDIFKCQPFLHLLGFGH